MSVDYKLVEEVLADGRPLIDAASEIDMLFNDFNKLLKKDPKLQLAVQKGTSQFSKKINQKAMAQINSGDSSVLKKVLDINKEPKIKKKEEKEQGTFEIPLMFNSIFDMEKMLSVNEDELREKVNNAAKNKEDAKKASNKKLTEEDIEKEKEENEVGWEFKDILDNQ